VTPDILTATLRRQSAHKFTIKHLTPCRFIFNRVHTDLKAFDRLCYRKRINNNILSGVVGKLKLVP
jgi:hypothetical protein